MCCFSRRIEHVSKTKIYARGAGGSRQFLVYAMSVAIEEDVAMVLPLPVPPASAEDAVTFVDLSSCPRFFSELDALFPDTSLMGAPQAFARHGPIAKTLVVHDVGDFEASFVPTRADFDRLDARFRLPADVWDALPQYADWGFAVFKLKPAKAEPREEPGFFERLFGGGERARIPTPTVERHPMAFEFPRRDASRLFFPTVHVHDGEVHATASFDHALYCQLGGEDGPPDWQVSVGKASTVWGKAKEWLRADALAYKRVLSGDRANADQYV
jgi:hypothetical protein